MIEHIENQTELAIDLEVCHFPAHLSLLSRTLQSYDIEDILKCVLIFF